MCVFLQPEYVYQIEGRRCSAVWKAEQQIVRETRTNATTSVGRHR